MPRRLQDWLEHLSQTHLPIQHSSALALAELAGPAGDDLGARDLEPLLERDPALALNLVRAANSHHHKHLEAFITTSEQAVLMLGMRRTLALASGWTTIEDCCTGNAHQRYLRTQADALLTARLAHHWAELRSDTLPAEIATAALARHAGPLALRADPLGQPAMASVDELAARARIPRTDAEYIILGFPTDELSAGLNTSWHLPTLALEYLLAEQMNARRSLGIRLAMALRAIGHAGWADTRVQALLQVLADYLGTSRETAAATIPDTASGVLATFRLDEEPAWAPLATAVTTVATETGRGVCLPPRWPLFQRLLTEIRSGDLDRIRSELTRRHERIDPDAPVLTLAARALHHGLGLDRAVVLLANQRSDGLFPYLALGAESDPGLVVSHVSLTPAWLERHLPPGRAARLLRAGESDSLRTQLRRGGGRLFDSPEYLVRSVAGPRGSFALLFGDRHAPDCTIDDAARDGFNDLVSALDEGWPQAPRLPNSS
ncbi:MAG: HDOD domain-containing protein [Ectothiorhodospiraceae bacterium]